MSSTFRIRELPLGKEDLSPGSSVATYKRTIDDTPIQTPTETPTQPFGLGSAWCADYLTTGGRREPHDLDIVKTWGKPWRLDASYRRDYGWYYRHYEYMHWFRNDSQAYWDQYNKPTSTIGDWDASILANLALKPVVDLPLFLFELKDLPRTLRDLGRIKSGKGALSDIPGQFVAANFSWLTLFSDLKKLFQIQESMMQRIAELQNMKEGKRIKRTLGSSSSNSVYGNVWLRPPVKLTVETAETRRTWFTARVTNPDSDSISHLITMYRRGLRSDDFFASDAFKDIMGLSVSRQSVVTVWNAIPWSWLIDWLFDIGTYLQAKVGKIPHQIKDICVMETIDSRYTFAHHSNYTHDWDDDFTFEPGYHQYLSKSRRALDYLQPKAKLVDFLTLRQTTLLASLALMKF